METILNTIYAFMAKYWLNVLGAILIFVIGRWLAKVLSKLVGKAMTKAKVDPILTNFLQHLCQISLLTFVVIAALKKLGIPMTEFTVVVGAAGLESQILVNGIIVEVLRDIRETVAVAVRVGIGIGVGIRVGIGVGIRVGIRVGIPVGIRVAVRAGIVVIVVVVIIVIVVFRRRPFVRAAARGELDSGE